MYVASILIVKYLNWVAIRVESGLDDPDNLGHLGHIFGAWVKWVSSAN